MKFKKDKTYTLKLSEDQADVFGSIAAGLAQSLITESKRRGTSQAVLDRMADTFVAVCDVLDQLHSLVKPDEPRPTRDVFLTTAEAIRCGWGDEGIVKAAATAFDNQSPEFLDKIKEIEDDPAIARRLKAQQAADRMASQGGSWGL